LDEKLQNEHISVLVATKSRCEKFQLRKTKDSQFLNKLTLMGEIPLGDPMAIGFR